MKLKQGFALRKLGREFILTAEGASQVNFNKMIALNSSAAYLWQSLEDREFTLQDVVDLLLEKYEGVEESVARKDASALLEKWVEEGLASE